MTTRLSTAVTDTDTGTHRELDPPAVNHSLPGENSLPCPVQDTGLVILSAVSPWNISAPQGAKSFHEVTADSMSRDLGRTAL